VTQDEKICFAGYRAGRKGPGSRKPPFDPLLDGARTEPCSPKNAKRPSTTPTSRPPLSEAARWGGRVNIDPDAADATTMFTPAASPARCARAPFERSGWPRRIRALQRTARKPQTEPACHRAARRPRAVLERRVPESRANTLIPARVSTITGFERVLLTESIENHIERCLSKAQWIEPSHPRSFHRSRKLREVTGRTDPRALAHPVRNRPPSRR